MLTGMVGLQIMAFIATLIILTFRSYIAEMFLQHLMQNYYIHQSSKEMMDTVQLNVSVTEHFKIEII